MGGCCCCLSRKSALEQEPIYDYLPQVLEDNVPLSSTHDALPAALVLLVDPNLGLSAPNVSPESNALQPLVYLTNSQEHPRNTENHASKNEPRPVGHAVDGRIEEHDICHGLNELDGKNVLNPVSSSPKVKEVLSTIDTSTTPFADEEDVCPTCLEEYDAENPRIITKCKHHFHLSCILEWLERSSTCAICDKIMEVEDDVMLGKAL